MVGRKAWVCLLALFTGVISADESLPSVATAPFAVSNTNPFILIHGLPAMEEALVLGAGSTSFQFQLDITNNSKSSLSGNESVTLDGETYRARLIWKRGLGNGWQVGAELPLISHRNGVMDNFIESWHDLFGLSNSDRDPGPKNRLLYRYERDGSTLTELSDGTSGLGDLRLLASKQLSQSASGNVMTLHTELKLPTGEADRLRGSGAADLAVWVSGAVPALWPEQKLGGYAQAGLLVMGEADVLPALQRDLVWFAGFGFHWEALDWLVLKCQVDLHDAFYRSDLDQLGSRSSLLTVGGAIPMDQGRSAIDLAIGENLATDTTPDFMINLAYRKHF
ncbi:MAG: DUF3187 family protein [Candidatus Thiodiazotropha sp. (ex Monitilora ramsayi)]|nr:DUF3187 family protein [Candidatus Thiodiazotropha sp. (ex Monitilora ramsayi)]